MKRILGIGVATLITGVGLAVVPAPAQADTWGCVTKSEFYSVAHGWTRGRVAATFDTAGTVLAVHGPWTHRDQVIAYKKCRAWGPGYAGVAYDNYSHDKYPGDNTMRVYAKKPTSPWSLVWW